MHAGGSVIVFKVIVFKGTKFMFDLNFGLMGPARVNGTDGLILYLFGSYPAGPAAWTSNLRYLRHIKVLAGG